MVVWWVYALIAVAFIAMALLMPTPDQEDAKAQTLGDINFPITEEGTPIYLAWGRVRIRAPNVLWYGDFKTIKIREKVKTGLFSSKSITVGYRYFIGLHLGLALHTGAGAIYRRIWFGEKRIAWTGTASGDETLINIDKPDLLGGKKNGGGLVGPFRLYGGTFTQTINSYLEGKIGSGDVPAYRGLAHIVMEQVEIGERTNIEPISVELDLIPDALGFGGVGSDGDANPIEVIYDILTNPWGRLSETVANINTTSFNAAAQTLEDEGHGFSLVVQRPNEAGNIISEILRQIDAVIFEEPTTREIHIKLIRNDYDVDTVPVFSEDEIIKVSDYSRSLWQDVFNQVRVIYNERDSNYKNRTAFANDISLISIIGGIKSTDMQFPGISNPALANQIVARELNNVSIPLAKSTLIMNRSATELRPGDVIKWVWPDYKIAAMFIRVFDFDLGTLTDGQVGVVCFEDRFSVSHTVFADPPAGTFTPPSADASPVTIRQVIELPRFLGNKLLEAGEADGATADESYLGHHALQPSSLDIEFNAEVSDDAGANYFVDLVEGEFAHSALVETAVDFAELEYDTVTGIRIKNITDSSVLASASEAEVADGVNMVLIGDELIGYRSFTDLTGGVYRLNNVWRGMLDTTPGDHAVDDRIWFVSQNGLDQYGSTNFVGTEALKARYLTFTGAAVLSASAAGVDDITLQKRPQCAFPPDLVTINATAHPAESVVDPVVLAWARRDRLATSITRPDASDEVPETLTEYILRWRLDGGSWTEINMGAVVTYNLTVGSNTGVIDIEIYGQRDSDTTLRSLYPVTRTFNMNVP